MLHGLVVPGYEGYPGGVVSITQYLSANEMFGGNSTTGGISAAMQKVGHANNDVGIFSRPGMGRLFTGQGSPENLVAAMEFINKYKDQFKAIPALKDFFKEADFLQAMCEKKCFGLDCIGFIGTYLVSAGLEPKYPELRPLDYVSRFKPVKSLDEVTDYSVVMLTSGLHIQMIDTVNERGSGFIKVDLCQSSSGGPQCNKGVTIRSGGGSYLPVEEFRSALNDQSRLASVNAERQKRGENPLDRAGYETYLRFTMTKTKTAFGYCGGAIFTITATGEPHNPVSGSVYIGSASITIRAVGP